jgi:hypothetical protein
MKKRTIKIGKGQFIGQVCPFLPSNAYIDKSEPGRGATTGELLCERNSIILVPNVPVITGKVESMKNYFDRHILGVFYPQNNVSEIVKYLESDIPFKKIITTPESYKYVCIAFESLKDKFNRYNDFFLLYDESEKMVQDVSYRKTIIGPLNDFFEYKERSMISATPILPSDPRFEQYGFEHITFQPDYDYSKPLNLLVTNNVPKALKDYLSETADSCYCIFMNSTEGIYSLITYLGIIEESQVFCSDDSVKKLRRVGYLNCSSTLLPPKKFNFYTSRFYSAVDINLDMKPNVILLTDVYFAEFSIFDPSTESVQAIGRFRNGVKSSTHITNLNHKIAYQTREMIQSYLDGSFEAYQRIYTLKESSRQNTGDYDAYDKALKVIPFKNFVMEGTCRKDYFKIDNKLDEEMVRSYYSRKENLIAAYNAVENFRITVSEKRYMVTDEDRYKREMMKSESEAVRILVEQLDSCSKSEELFVIDNTSELLWEIQEKYSEIYSIYKNLGSKFIKEHNYNLAKLRKIHKKKVREHMFAELPVLYDFMHAYRLEVDVTCKELNSITDGLKVKHKITGSNIEILGRYYTVSPRFQKQLGNNRIWYRTLTNPKFIR